MKTIKLYEENSYLTSFQAKVLSCVPMEQDATRYRVVLDQTAFYPEGGGQPFDTGILGGVPVLAVHDRGGAVVHELSAALPEGETVSGEIDWERRFSNMQNHTGEHIVSGIMKKHFDADNIGFHLGSETVTIDFGQVFTEEEIQWVQNLANEAVYMDLTVQNGYPGKDALAQISYRSKKEIADDIRIVTIPGYDVCACCGTHTGTTGAVGGVKILSVQNYKGGTRWSMLCGKRAMADYDRKNEMIRAIAAELSVKQYEAADAVMQLLQDIANLKHKNAETTRRLYRQKAQAFKNTTDRIVLSEEGLSQGELQKYVLEVLAAAPLSPFVAAVSPSAEQDGVLHIAVMSDELDVRGVFGYLKENLEGRGGGTQKLVQGNLRGEIKDVERLLSEVSIEPFR